MKKFFLCIFIILAIIVSCFYGKFFASAMSYEFLTLSSIFGNNKDIHSFRLNQNLMKYFKMPDKGLSKPEALYFHQGITSDSSYIYFCDKGEGEIEVYDFLGNPIRTIGTVGNVPGSFQILSDVCLDESGKIYALDSYKNNIQIFDKTGSFLREFSLRIASDKFDPLPLMMTLSNDQNLFILDSNNGGKIFSKNGKHLGNFVSPLAESTSENLFQYVTDMCSDEFGHVYLLDNIPVDGSPYFWIYGADGKILHQDPIALSFGEDDRTSNLCLSFSYFEGNFYLSLMTELESKVEKTFYKSSCLRLNFEKKVGKEGDVYFSHSMVLIENFLNLPMGILKTRNHLIGLDANDNRLVFYDQKGNLIKEVRSSSNTKLLSKPISLVADINGTINICEENGKIVFLNLSKNEVSMLDSNNFNLPLSMIYGDKWNPSIVEIDHIGNSYCYDSRYGIINVLDSSKKLIQSIPIAHSVVKAMDFNDKGDLVILARDESYYQGIETSVEIYSSSKSTKTVELKSSFPIPDFYASDLSIGDNEKIYFTAKDKLYTYSMTGEKLEEKEFEGLSLDKLFVAAENIIYLLASSSVIKIDVTGKVLNQQNLGWFQLADISGNLSGDIFIIDNFHGLLLTFKDSTFQQKVNPPLLLVADVDEETYFSSVELKGRTIAGYGISINSKPVMVRTDGTFSEKQNLFLGTNQFLIRAKGNDGPETIKSITVKMLPQQIISLTIGPMGSNKLEAFIDKETKRTYVVFRSLLETFGGIVLWEADTQKVTYQNQFTNLEVYIGNPKARINGKTILMDPNFPTKVYPRIINNKTYAPLRFIAETCGFKVLWNPKNNQIILSFPDENFTPQEPVDPPEDFDSLEWSKQYGISRSDYVGPITVNKNGYLSMINYTNRSNGDFWFLRVDPTGKPVNSFLYSFPHDWNNRIDFKVNDNQIFSAFVDPSKDLVHFIDGSKNSPIINYCSIDSTANILESKTLSINSKQKMKIKFDQAFPLSKNRYMLIFTNYLENDDKINRKGCLIIDSSGKFLSSYMLKADQENDESSYEIFSTGNDSFVYLIHHAKDNQLNSLEMIGFNVNGDSIFNTIFYPKTSRYTYPEVTPCKRGFLLKIINNEKSINYYLRFSEKGELIWQKEIQLKSENQESIIALKETSNEGFIFSYRSRGETQISFNAKNGKVEKTFRMNSESSAYVLACDFTTNILLLVGGKRLRSFADSNIWINKMNPEIPLYRYFFKGSPIPLVPSTLYEFCKGSTIVKKAEFPITIVVKDLVTPFWKNPVDHR